MKGVKKAHERTIIWILAVIAMLKDPIVGSLKVGAHGN
jgi:hypothetical protein